MEVSVQLHASTSSFSGKEPGHPFSRRLNGPQSQPGSFDRKNFLPLLVIKLYIVQTVAKLLFRLRHLGELG
jgi:hypothetical protein